jgi:hypothetical protein
MVEQGKRPEDREDFGLVRNDDVDFTPVKRRKGVSPARFLISFVLLAAASVAFVLVLKHRLENPEVRVLRPPEDVMDDSLAQVHAAGRGRGMPKSRSLATTRHRAAIAYNKLNDELAALCDCWNGLMNAARYRSGGMDAQLAAAQAHIAEIGRCVDRILDAARSAGGNGYRLSRVGAAARNLHSLTQSEYEAFADLAAIAERSAAPGASADDRAVETDAYNGIIARLEDLYGRQEALVATMDEAARNVFKYRGDGDDD